MTELVELSGFGDVDKNSMDTVRRMVDGYARKLQDHCDDFQGLKVTLKNVHNSKDHPGRFELHGKLIDSGRTSVSLAVDVNLFVALDAAMRKLESGVAK
ncbi:hypothetical protein HY641_04155 [Candidatus Woesearchaeota archaeon]|nr:hypothetical protein [Candidatus Woesearchaeota archaeon]